MKLPACLTGNQRVPEVLTLCQGLDGQTLPAEEHHVLEGPPICFVCQVVSLDLRQGDEALGHPHKLHIHLQGRGSTGALGQQPPDIPSKLYPSKIGNWKLCFAQG